MKKEEVCAAVRMSAAEAITRVDSLLGSEVLTEEAWQELAILGCSLNNLWPETLQAPLPRWVAALAVVEGEPQEFAFVRRQLRALFWSLCKRKAELPRLNRLEEAFWVEKDPADPLAAAHNATAMIVSERSEACCMAGMLAMSRYFYQLRDDQEFRTLMMDVLNWTAAHPGSKVRAVATVVHAVHTEFDEMRAEVARTLMGANHLGVFLPFWALFQLDYLVLLELRNGIGSHPDATDLTRLVFEAICAYRLEA